MKRSLIYWTIILLCNYGVTMAVHYSLRQIWFAGPNDNTSLTTIETLFTIAVLPTFLVIANYWLGKKYDLIKYFLLNAAMICSCIFLSSRLHFFNWADSVGSRIHPDQDTLDVMALETFFGLVVTTIGLIIVFVRVFYNKRKKQHLINKSDPNPY